MPFRLRRDTRKWFQDISGDFEVDFDMYYLCLMVGLANGAHQKEIKGAEATDLVDTFPGPYKTKGRVIIALLLAAEIERMGIALDDRDAVHKRIRELVDPRSQSQLSEYGMKVLNQISFAGFDVLTEEFDDRPRSIESFLVSYTRNFDSLLNERAR